MAQEVLTSTGKGIPKLKPNQLIECRGGVWRFLQESNGLWELELLRQGSHYSEAPVKVWVIPQLEKDTLRVLKPSEAYTPYPSEENRQKSKLYKPMLAARKNKVLEDRRDSKEPQTAKQCAIEIKPWQFEPWRRIVDLLPFPRVLLGDDVGLGKTTEAAIILAELTRRRRGERILIIAPQHLCEKWQDELYERFGLAFEIYDRYTRERLNDRGVKNPWGVVEKVIVSRDFVKRWENLKPLENVKWDCIVIDECHHFVKDKNQSTKRLRELADKIVYNSPALLLLSATPFTGDKEQFNSLIQLIDPKFYMPEYLEQWNRNNPYLIRRNKKFLSESENEVFFQREIVHHEIDESSLSKKELEVIHLVDAELINSRGRADRKHWDMLLEEVAKKRLSSSWKAFYETISGDKKLGTWFSESTKKKINSLIENYDSGKLKRLSDILEKEILTKDNKSKVVIFTEAIPTMEFIKDYLVNKCKYKKDEVAVLEGSTSRTIRLQIEEDFANPSSKLKILIATDTISEGKDLQHTCNHLIHFELPWSFVKIEQRNGRIDRLGQNATPYIHNLVFNSKVTPDQKVIDKLQSKVEKAGQSIGSVNQIVEIIGDLSYSQLLESEKLDKEIDKQIKSVESNQEEFGFSISDFTAQSNSPIIEDDEIDRISQFQIMLESVGGKLIPNGKAQHEFKLSIPDDWEIHGLDIVGEDTLPTESTPWRITFNPGRYLEYEEYRRGNGDHDRYPLHFLSPIHPIYQQVESRFRLRLEKGGFPIFHVQGGIFPEVILAELTVRSKSSRIIAQKIIAIELDKHKEVDISLLGDFKPLDRPISLPSAKKWEKLEGTLTKKSKEYIDSLKQSYDKHIEQFKKDQKNLSSKEINNKDVIMSRQGWIDDFWVIDTDSIQFQVTALLIDEGRKS